MKYEITRQINLPKLHMEMLSANIIEPGAYFSAEYFIARDDADMAEIEKIIAQHDAAPIPQPTNDDILTAKIELQTLNLLIDLGVI